MGRGLDFTAGTAKSDKIAELEECQGPEVNIPDNMVAFVHYLSQGGE